jgi:hypothetical protein
LRGEPQLVGDGYANPAVTYVQTQNAALSFTHDIDAPVFIPPTSLCIFGAENRIAS